MGCGGSGTWLFLRCSGVAGREDGGEEGARVGEEAASDGAGKAEGSNSRSGTKGETRGLRVILRRTNRKAALERI